MRPVGSVRPLPLARCGVFFSGLSELVIAVVWACLVELTGPEKMGAPGERGSQVVDHCRKHGGATPGRHITSSFERKNRVHNVFLCTSARDERHGSFRRSRLPSRKEHPKVDQRNTSARRRLTPLFLPDCFFPLGRTERNGARSATGSDVPQVTAMVGSSRVFVNARPTVAINAEGETIAFQAKNLLSINNINALTGKYSKVR